MSILFILSPVILELCIAVTLKYIFCGFIIMRIVRRLVNSEHKMTVFNSCFVFQISNEKYFEWVQSENVGTLFEVVSRPDGVKFLIRKASCDER